ncbi:MAG: DNA polymerase III subunit alpha, partial [Gammaproteobacteria bacterium]|nr:DNA polymerase III subunit alpha [Gammaproteobacteria bacterium]
MKNAFVHLHLHTEYSIIDSTVRIPQLMSRCSELGMPAVAMTDQGNLFALIKFYKQALASGIKPIIGADLHLHNADEADRPYGMVLLCQDRDGYRNLSRLITRSFTEGQYRGAPQIRTDWMTPESCSGLIALSTAQSGDIGRALHGGHPETANERPEGWRAVFRDRLYLEICRTGRSDEDELTQKIVEFAAAAKVPLVASNDVRFLAKDDFEAHEARVCIQQGRTLNEVDRPRSYSDQQFLKSPDEMRSLFADIPEALENAWEIALRCNLELKLGETFLPAFPIPAGKSTEEFLTSESVKGLEARLRRKGERGEIGESNREIFEAPYQKRLKDEISVICEMGFAGYFLIVADFIRWAREQEIPVGPGRGSGAGSLVAYVLGITDLDPLEHDLLFERFLNPERVSMPDFDIDFCMEGRDRVIEYVAERYGRDRVSQIITYGTMAARAVIRDVGRALGQPYGFVDKVAKQVPFEIGMTLDKALEQDDELAAMYRDDDEVKSI